MIAAPGTGSPQADFSHFLFFLNFAVTSTHNCTRYARFLELLIKQNAKSNDNDVLQTNTNGSIVGTYQDKLNTISLRGVHANLSCCFKAPGHIFLTPRFILNNNVIVPFINVRWVLIKIWIKILQFII